MNNELATQNNSIEKANENAIEGFVNGIISTVKAETMDERLQVYNAINEAEELQAHLNEVIEVENVIMQPVTLTNEQGEEVEAKRIVLLDKNGTPYGTVSSGVETSLRNLFAIVGMPPWNPAIPLKPVSKQGRNGWKFTNLVYSPETKKAAK